MNSNSSERRALYTPTSVQSHFGLGARCFVEMHRRVLGGAFGRIPEALSQDAFAAGGYCLDAHDIMPAGSMMYSRFGPEAEDWIWSSSVALRGEG